MAMRRKDRRRTGSQQVRKSEVRIVSHTDVEAYLRVGWLTPGFGPYDERVPMTWLCNCFPAVPIGAALTIAADMELNERRYPQRIVIGEEKPVPVFHPWKRNRRDFWKKIAEQCFAPNGEPPERLSNGQVIKIMCNQARNFGHEADFDTDGSSILRATGRKP
jgi:hypothetical protein